MVVTRSRSLPKSDVTPSNSDVTLTEDEQFLKDLSVRQRDPVLDEPRFLLSDVAAAAAVSLPVLKAWLSREPRVVALGPFDREAIGKGSSRVFTLRRVLATALTGELVRLGIAPSRAGASVFAATDDAIASHFISSEAVLILHGEDGLMITDKKVTLADLFETNILEAADARPPPSFVAVSIGRIFEMVESRLKARGKMK